MNKKEEYELFLENLQTCAIKDYQDTYEADINNKLQDRMDEVLATNFTDEQKLLIEEILLEKLLCFDRKADLMYHQGIKDCIWLLKNLGVLA